MVLPRVVGKDFSTCVVQSAVGISAFFVGAVVVFVIVTSLVFGSVI